MTHSVSMGYTLWLQSKGYNIEKGTEEELSVVKTYKHYFSKMSEVSVNSDLLYQ